MKLALNKIIISCVVIVLISCVASTKKVEDTDPVQGTESQNSSDQQFLLRIKNSEMAMSLLGKAQTQLKSGNSRGAIVTLTKAREFNPWHDDIKDTYILAVKSYLKATERLINKGIDCKILAQRLSVINSISQDEIGRFSGVRDKCKIAVESLPIVNLDGEFSHSKHERGVELTVAKDLEKELNLIIERNKYVPIRELLIAGIKYLQKTTYEVRKIEVDQNTTDDQKNSLKVHIEERFNGPNKFEYCDQIRKIIEVNGTGYYLKCKSLPEKSGYQRSGFLNYSESAYIPVPKSWASHLEKLFPVPRKAIFRLIIHYKDGSNETFFQPITISKEMQIRVPIESEKCRPRKIIGTVPTHCVRVQSMSISKANLANLKSISIVLDPEKTYLENLQ